MIENVLWIAVAFMLLGSIIPKTVKARRMLSAAGWVFFSMHWFYQPIHYMEIKDYFNVALVIAVGIVCLIIAYTMFKEYKENKIPLTDVTTMATSATALGCLFYFPFAQMEVLNIGIISQVTNTVFLTLQYINVPAELVAWNKISLNGYTVEIILACTAIESIALFIGLIASVNAPVKRLAAAFTVSVPVIYILNIIRDAFVIVAYGYQWFGPESFEIAHNTIAKIGSGIALFVVAYFVMRILPELVDLIEGVWFLVTGFVQKLFYKVVGNQ
ncbi:archaeosortase A, PGF-CTERM-specific [Methanolobus tindarius DSM 2278]|uniref:Archaeosortase A, PGF-CTERM-specific n=1 Tax=Methanolobus tindarius DSM 2278 TaxID=1090322 RepID=W9DQB2_METTI|nr:archaeosortase A [Methanolobus tindarius]ETA67495.1 archaeosortase A, PGF-CTERM-specific [Methanolobus tindarius DSM 2278]